MTTEQRKSLEQLNAVLMDIDKARAQIDRLRKLHDLIELGSPQSPLIEAARAVIDSFREEGGAPNVS